MKTRFGFVSNSSSTSFIMVGIDAEKIGIEELKKQLVNKSDFKLPDDTTLEDTDIGEITGYEFDVVDDRYFGIKFLTGDDIGTLSLNELSRKEKMVRKLLDKIGFPDAKIELIAGTEYN